MVTESAATSPPRTRSPLPRPSAAGLVALDLLYLLLAVPLTLRALWRMVSRGKGRHGFWGKWGLGLAQATRGLAGPTLWVHAVSVGEVRAAVPVVAALRRRFPDLPVVISTTTETGHATARALFRDCAVVWFPWDVSFVVARWFQRLRPRLVVLIEVDLWPNFMRVAARRGVPVAIVSGKLSDRSAARYTRLLRSPLAPLVRAMWGRLAAVCVQSALDGERVERLVGDPAGVHVTGNVKFDFPVPEVGEEERRGLRARLGIAPDDLVLVAGSTHETEEDLLGAAFGAVQPDFRRGEGRGVHLLLVPRHPERFGAVWERVSRWGFTSQRWSQPSGEAALVTLVDEMGLLMRLYAIADVAIVCGSFVPHVGGHNVLEPAAFGVPVVFGPHMHSQRSMRDALVAAGGCVQVKSADAESLAAVLRRLLGDGAERRRIGENARRALEGHRGSAERSVDVVAELLDG